jgi:hypothetical protein
MNPLDELIAQTLQKMTMEDKFAFAQEPSEHPGAQFHFSNGMAMRNSLRLWEHDSPLTKWFCEQGIYHGDDRSAVIFKALWCRMRNQPFNIEQEAAYYRDYWKDKGLGADGKPL